MRNLQQQQEREKEECEASCSSAFSRVRRDDNTMVSNSLQIPVISLPLLERPPTVENVYTSDNMTIIDTDAAAPVSVNPPILKAYTLITILNLLI